MCCCGGEPTYARYHSNSKYNVNGVTLDNILGSILEMDPSLLDREEGVTKINSWIEEVAPDTAMSPEQVEISRWKCIKYWEAQHSSEMYGNDYATSGVKLTGSCVRFYFEKPAEGATCPRLVIEHCGRSVQVQEEERRRCLPAWIRRLPLISWRPFQKKTERRNSTNSRCEIVSSEPESHNTRYA